MRFRIAVLVSTVGLLLGSCGMDADESPSSANTGVGAATDGATDAATDATTVLSVAPTSAPAATVPSGGAAGTTPPNAAAEGAVAGITALFAAVPNDPAYLGQVTAVDWDAATAAVGATRPAPGAAIDDPATEAWLRAFAGPAPLRLHDVSFEGGTMDVDAWRRELGFSLFETSASATFLELDTGSTWRPLKRLSLFGVDVDAATIDAAVRSDPIWSGDLVDKQAGGTPYYFWTADGTQNLERASVVRPTGVGGTMAVLDDVVIRARVEEELVAALTVADGDTLADRSDVAAVLAALEPYAPHGVSMSNELVPLIDDHAEAIPAPLRAFELRASAESYVDGQQVIILALVHADAVDATENAARLERNLSEGGPEEQPWRERFESWTVTADGPLVIAVIADSDNPALPFQAFDQLLRSEPS